MILGLDRPDKGSVTIDGRAYARPPVAAARGRRAARGQGDPPGPQRPQPPARARGIQQDRPRRGSTRCSSSSGSRAVASKRAGGFSLGMGQRLGHRRGAPRRPRRCSCSTSRSTASTPRASSGSASCSARLAKQGRTVFVSSHLMSEMALTADHVIVIGRGRLLEDADIGTMIAKARHQRHGPLARTPTRLAAAITAAGGDRRPRADDGALTVTDLDARRDRRPRRARRARPARALAAACLARGGLHGAHQGRRGVRRRAMSRQGLARGDVERVDQVPHRPLDDLHARRHRRAVRRPRRAHLVRARLARRARRLHRRPDARQPRRASPSRRSRSA